MKTYNVNKLSTNIKSRRKALKLSREEMAKKAGVNYNTIIKLESGANKNPTIKTLLGIAKIFSVSIEELLT
jgi:transcriptional regulator with XRE-family HTH domain